MTQVLSGMFGIAADLAEQVSMSEWQKQSVEASRDFVRSNKAEMDKITPVAADPIQNPEVSLMSYARSDVSFFKDVVTMAIKAVRVLDDRSILKTLVSSNDDVPSIAWSKPRKVAGDVIASLNTTLSVSADHILYHMIRNAPESDYSTHGL